jgi:hypothetical protein
MDLFFFLVAVVVSFGLSIIHDPLTRRLIEDMDECFRR